MWKIFETNIERQYGNVDCMAWSWFEFITTLDAYFWQFIEIFRFNWSAIHIQINKVFMFSAILICCYFFLKLFSSVFDGNYSFQYILMYLVSIWYNNPKVQSWIIEVWEITKKWTVILINASLQLLYKVYVWIAFEWNINWTFDIQC